MLADKLRLLHTLRRGHPIAW